MISTRLRGTLIARLKHNSEQATPHEGPLLRAVIAPILVLSVIAIPIIWLPGVSPAPFISSLSSALFVVTSAVAFRLARGSWVRPVAWFFFVSLQAVIGSGIVVSGGVRSPVVTALAIVVLFAGLVLGIRGAVVFTLLAAGFVGALLGLDALGYGLPAPPPGVSEANAYVVSVIVLLACMYLAVLVSRLRTELVQTEQKLTFEESLQESRRFDALGRLAGGVAHDFNNILTAVLANGDMIATDPNATAEVRRFAQEIVDAAERARALTGQLLAVARKQVAAPVFVSLRTVVRDLEPIVRRLIREDIEFEIRHDEGARTVRMDLAQLERLLVNLVTNSAAAMPEGGRLSLETLECEIDSEREVRGVRVEPGRYCVLQVADTGVGINPQTAERVFDPFYTTKELGSGLGLATVYGIVTQSGGHVEFDSEVGRGTTFRILLPAFDSPPTAEPAAASSDVPTLPSGLTVLVVDDDPTVRALAERILSGAGCNVFAAGSGAQALALVGGHEGRIDLLVSDVVLPEIAGPELAARMTAADPDLLVLFMSGYPDEIINQASLEPDCTLLPKPFSQRELIQKVAGVIASQ